MAKRTTPRADANDASVAVPRARSRRTQPNTSPEADTIAAYPGVERSEDDGVVGQAAATSAPGSEGFRAPSDQEIRERAYHRFLERGGTHGNEFDDWVQAERDLKNGH